MTVSAAARLLLLLTSLLGAALIVGCGNDNETTNKVERALAALHEAEQNHFEKHDRYTDRFPDLQLAGPAAVNDVLLGDPPLSHTLEISSSGRMVTVTVMAADDGEAQGWFTLLNGREYGSGGSGLDVSG